MEEPLLEPEGRLTSNDSIRKNLRFDSDWLESQPLILPGVSKPCNTPSKHDLVATPCSKTCSPTVEWECQASTSPPPVKTPPPPWAPKDRLRASAELQSADCQEGRCPSVNAAWTEWKDDLRSGEVRFPDLQDSLPSMVEVVARLGEFKAMSPGALCADGSGGIIKGSKIASTIMHMMDGETLSEKLLITWGHFWKKDELIRTVAALDDIVMRFHALEDDPGKFMWMSRYCYLGQCEHAERPLDSIFATTTLKICQLMYFMMLTLHIKVVKGYCRPPPEWMLEKVQELDIQNWSDPSMLEERFKDPLSSSLPIHPQWFCNSVPLLSQEGAFKRHCLKMMDMTENNPVVFAQFMHMLRSTLVHMQGSLRTHLDNVTTMQQKILMLMMSAFLSLLSWWFKSNVMAEVVSEDAIHHYHHYDKPC